MFAFYAHTFIDSVQSAKKQFVKIVVPQEKLADIINNFVDAQTKYTKEAVTVANETSTKLYKLSQDREFQEEIKTTMQKHLHTVMPFIYKSPK